MPLSGLQLDGGEETFSRRVIKAVARAAHVQHHATGSFLSLCLMHPITAVGVATGLASRSFRTVRPGLADNRDSFFQHLKLRLSLGKLALQLVHSHGELC